MASEALSASARRRGTRSFTPLLAGGGRSDTRIVAVAVEGRRLIGSPLLPQDRRYYIIEKSDLINDLSG